MGKKEKGPFDWLKAIKRLAVIALVCSVLLTAFLIYSASLTAKESAAQSSIVKNFFKELFSVNETVIPQKITVTETLLDDGYYFTNEKVKLPIITIPANASKEFDYTFSHEGCSVDENGYISYSGTGYTTVNVTVTSVHDSDVYFETQVLFRGISPIDEAVEDIGVEFYHNGKQVAYDELHVGKKYVMRTYLIIGDEYLESFGLTENKIYVKGLPYFIGFSDEDTASYEFDSTDRQIIFFDEYEGDITYKYRKAEGNNFFYPDGSDEPLTLTISIKVATDPTHNPEPKSAVMPHVGVYDEENDRYIVTVSEIYNTAVIYGRESVSGEDAMCKLEFADEESEKVAYIRNRYTLSRRAVSGECNLILRSLFDENNFAKITVIFKANVAESIEVVGRNAVALYGTDYYSYNYDTVVLRRLGVDWSIVKGADKATINSKGEFVAKKLGTVVIRAESIDFPGLYTDYTVNIVLWSDFHSFVRKMIGHFLLFGAVGMGYLTCFYFMIKKRWISLILTPVCVFSLSALTEFIQYHTEGRSGNIVDTCWNFLGGLCGMAATAVFAVIFMLCLKRFRPEAYARIKESLKLMSFYEVFGKKSK